MIAEIGATSIGEIINWVQVLVGGLVGAGTAVATVWAIGRKQGKRESNLTAVLATMQSAIASAKEEQKRDYGMVEKAIAEVAENMQQVVSRMEDLDRRTHEHDVKLAKLESTLSNIGQLAADVAGIRSEMSALRSDVARVEGSLSAPSKPVGRTKR